MTNTAAPVLLRHCVAKACIDSHSSSSCPAHTHLCRVGYWSSTVWTVRLQSPEPFIWHSSPNNDTDRRGRQKSRVFHRRARLCLCDRCTLYGTYWNCFLKLSCMCEWKQIKYHNSRIKCKRRRLGGRCEPLYYHYLPGHTQLAPSYSLSYHIWAVLQQVQFDYTAPWCKLPVHMQSFPLYMDVFIPRGRTSSTDVCHCYRLASRD